MKQYVVQNFQTNTFVSIANNDASDLYKNWGQPAAIIVDGPYGIGGFPSDPQKTSLLPEWYAKHVSSWSNAATPETTLWFWGTELGWAVVHPLLDVNGWDYQEANIWDKGIGHIAGNVNSKTIRKSPVVTEVCVRYTKRVLLPLADGTQACIKDWLRAEWIRSGLSFSKTNEACGVRNAATRKYFTKDDLWYFPPAEAMEQLSAYANKYGKATSRPYLSLNGKTPVTACEWEHMQAKWNHTHGLTNVWHVPALHNKERLKSSDGKAIHANQKPKEIIRHLILSSTDEGDIVWDPFAGLATMGICCMETNRTCYSSEISDTMYEFAVARLQREQNDCYKERVG